jgi:hypothetical protein
MAEPRLRLASGTSLAWIIAAVLLVAAIVVQSGSWIGTDTSFMLTLGSQYLDGRAIYRDVIEINPPASMLLYLPAIKLARLLGVRPEFMTSALVFSAGLGSAAASLGLLRRAGLIAKRYLPYYYCAVIAIFFILPGSAFTEREHIALILLIPAMAAIMVRTCKKSVPIAYALAAGICLGVTISIKPHFLLGYGPMVAWSIWRTRSLAPAWTVENICGAAVALAYVATVFLCFPDFIYGVLPVLRDVYLPVRLDTATLLFCPSMAAQGRISKSLALPALLGSAGFAVIAMIQGKGWLYHFYPALSLGMMALLIVIAEEGGTVRARQIAAIGLFAAFGISTWQFAQTFDYDELYAKLRTVAPPHPRILLASGDVKDGHPITRWLDGSWVGSSPALWMAAGVTYRLIHDKTLSPADRARFANYTKLEVARPISCWRARAGETGFSRIPPLRKRLNPIARSVRLRTFTYCGRRMQRVCYRPRAASRTVRVPTRIQAGSMMNIADGSVFWHSLL